MSLDASPRHETIPIVLVHGGGFGASCWDRLLPFLEGPVLAVDLPGRGVHPAPLESVTIEGAAASVVEDIDARAFEEVVLVGHSLAGCSMPATIGLLGKRIRHAVFVACTVPDDGTSAFDTLDPEMQARARRAEQDREPGVLSPELVRSMFGNDLDDEQFAWCLEQIVPEAPGLVTQAVDLSPLQLPVPRTWVRPLRDAIVDPDKQLRYAGNVGQCDVIDLDAGHMCMIGKPDELGSIINGIAAACYGAA
jgi:pimeloyl-ACP methyl ester carboxylesterase